MASNHEHDIPDPPYAADSQDYEFDPSQQSNAHLNNQYNSSPSLFSQLIMCGHTITRTVKFAMTFVPFGTLFLVCVFIIPHFFLIWFTQFFTHHLVFNVFTPFHPGQLFGWIFPPSFSWLLFSLIIVTYHASCIEERRGTSYLLTFVGLISTITYLSLFILQLFLTIVLPTNAHNWFAHHGWIFNTLGLDFLPFILLILNVSLSNHHYLHIMGFPIEFHVITVIIITTLCYFITNWCISLPILLACLITFCGIPIWRSPGFTKFAGMLLVPILIRPPIALTVQRHVALLHHEGLDTDEHNLEIHIAWMEAIAMDSGIIPLCTSDDVGVLVGIKNIFLQRHLIPWSFYEVSVPISPRCCQLYDNNYNYNDISSLQSHIEPLTTADNQMFDSYQNSTSFLSPSSSSTTTSSTTTTPGSYPQSQQHQQSINNNNSQEQQQHIGESYQQQSQLATSTSSTSHLDVVSAITTIPLIPSQQSSFQSSSGGGGGSDTFDNNEDEHSPMLRGSFSRSCAHHTTLRHVYTTLSRLGITYKHSHLIENPHSVRFVHVEAPTSEEEEIMAQDQRVVYIDYNRIPDHWDMEAYAKKILAVHSLLDENTVLAPE